MLSFITKKNLEVGAPLTDMYYKTTTVLTFIEMEIGKKSRRILQTSGNPPYFYKYLHFHVEQFLRHTYINVRICQSYV